MAGAAFRIPQGEDRPDAVGCCEATDPELAGVRRPAGPRPPSGWAFGGPAAELDRRTALKGLLAAAGVLWVSSCSRSPGEGAPLRLAFCGQLLCVVPYEVARTRGHFADEGLAIELIYTRGGNQAMQALVGGAVDYAGTSFDVALQAAANGAGIRRVASTGRLPLFALAVAPGMTADIGGVADLEGRTVGISALGNADHALALYLLDEAGADPGSVRFAAVGTNLFDALRLGQVDAGMLQEPALSLTVAAGGRELVNLMEIEQTHAALGGPYEFMGVSVRAGERDARLAEIRSVARALSAGLADTRTLPPDEIIAALPEPLVAGGDVAELRRIVERYRLSLYPEAVTIDVEAALRVVRAQEIAGLLEPGSVDLATLLDTGAAGA